MERRARAGAGAIDKGRQKKKSDTDVGGWVGDQPQNCTKQDFLAFACKSHHRALKSTRAYVVCFSIPSNVQTYVKIIAIRPVRFRYKMQKSSVGTRPVAPTTLYFHAADYNWKALCLS